MRYRLRRFGTAVLCALALGAGGGAAAQARVAVELEAPGEVRELLERHLRLLARDTPLPELAADRSALARRTRREVADLLATEGYFSPTVKLERAAAAWRLVVEPGARARIGEVAIAFEGELADDPAAAARIARLRANWALPVGEPFRQALWDGAKQRLLDEVGAVRYAAARIAHSRAEVDPDAATVRLTLTVDSGPAFYLGALQVSGLHDLPPDLVARHSTLEAGAPYDRDVLLAFQSALQNAPQFASVIVDIDRDPALAAAAPVRVQIAEARPRHLGFGAGYSSNTGYRVEAGYRDVNLWARGWELSTGLRLEQRRQSAYADVFLPPVEARRRDSVGALAERSDLEGLKITTQALAVARHITRGDIETRLTLRVQREALQPDGAESSSADTLTANWAWVQRAVDNVLDPRRGYVLEFQVGGGASVALAEQDFVRFYARYQHYFPVRESDALIVRMEGGATLAERRDGIPQDFLFRAGGTQSVRGYAYQSLGVKEGDATVGGRYLLAGSAEYVRWFRPDWGAAVFVDSGDAADSRAEFRARTGYGVGARWRSPAGPLAVDVAWGQDERRLRLHFGVAIAF